MWRCILFIIQFIKTKRGKNSHCAIILLVVIPLNVDYWTYWGFRAVDCRRLGQADEIVKWYSCVEFSIVLISASSNKLPSHLLSRSPSLLSTYEKVTSIEEKLFVTMFLQHFLILSLMQTVVTLPEVIHLGKYSSTSLSVTFKSRI